MAVTKVYRHQHLLLRNDLQTLYGRPRGLPDYPVHSTHLVRRRVLQGNPESPTDSSPVLVSGPKNLQFITKSSGMDAFGYT